MDARFVEALVALARQAGVIDFEYESGGECIRFSFGTGGTGGTGGIGGRAAAAADSQAAPAGDAVEVAAAACVQRSSMDAIFFRSPSQGTAPFASEGEVVVEGQTVGLLEVMKMLTPVEATRAGTILAFHAEDGQRLAAGDAILSIAAP